MRPDVVLPRYGEAALTDILPSVLGAVGVRGEQDVIGLPAGDRFCVLLVDGLGSAAVAAHPRETPFLSSLRRLGPGGALTASVPSTTATSLTSLGTGLPPGRHGVVGYTSRVPGVQPPELFHSLTWEPAVDPHTYQPYPSVFERAQRAGVEATVIGMRRFRGSGLTSVALRSDRFRSADTYGQRVATAVAALDRPGPALAYVYEPDLDTTGHVQGRGSDAWRHQLAMVDRFAEELFDALPTDTVLLVTADHGMVDVAAEDRVDVDDVPALRSGTTLVAGEARFRHVFTVPGAAADVAAAWAGTLGPAAQVRTREQAVAAGWFGPVDERVTERIGDVVAAMVGPGAVERRTVFPGETRLIGMHGGLTSAEMLVPLLADTA